MIGEDDFFEDQLLIRQVRRAAREEAGDFDDDEEDNYAPRGSQRNAEPIDDYDITQDIDEDEDEDEKRRQNLLKIKRERLSSRGLSMAPSSAQGTSSEPDEDEIEAM